MYELNVTPLLLFIVIVGALLALVNFVGATIYDIRESRKRKLYLKHPNAKRYRHRPMITVIIAAYNNETSIERCLNSLTKNSYRKLEVIVVDHASQDDTKSLVNNFIADHPKKNIRLVVRRTTGSQPVIFKDVFKKYGHGELVMLLSGASTVEKQALRNAVNQYNASPILEVLIPKQRVRATLTVVSLFQSYMELLSNRTQKLNSLTNRSFQLESSAVFCRKENLTTVCKRVARDRRKLITTRLNCQYAHDVVVYDQPAESFYALCQRHYRLLLNRFHQLPQTASAKFLSWVYRFLIISGVITALLTPLLISYFIFLALKLQEPTPLIISGVVLSIFLLSAIWDDERLLSRQKLSYSLGIPITYGLFYLLALVQIVLLIKTALLAIGQIITRNVKRLASMPQLQAQS